MNARLGLFVSVSARSLAFLFGRDHGTAREVSMHDAETGTEQDAVGRLNQFV
jgi:hypothetical protein